MYFRPSIHSNPLQRVAGGSGPKEGVKEEGQVTQAEIDLINERLRQQQQEEEGLPMWAKVTLGAGAALGAGALIWAATRR